MQVGIGIYHDILFTKIIFTLNITNVTSSNVPVLNIFAGPLQNFQQNTTNWQLHTIRVSHIRFLVDLWSTYSLKQQSYFI